MNPADKIGQGVRVFRSRLKPGAHAPNPRDEGAAGGRPEARPPTNPLRRHAQLQLKDYQQLLGSGSAPLSHIGGIALAIANKIFEKEDIFPFPSQGPSRGFLPWGHTSSKRVATTVIQNEPSLDGPASNPTLVVQASNDYRDIASPKNPGIHAYLNFDQNVEDPNSLPVNIPVSVNRPDLFGGMDGGQGDPIVAADPINPNIVHFLYMAFNFEDQNKNSIQLSDFDLSKMDQERGDSGQLGTYTVVEHTRPNPDGSPSDFEDKNAMAVDPASGTILVTNTQFAGDGSGSRINAYILSPKFDDHGNPTGQYDLLNQDGRPWRVTAKGMWVQWSQPGFLPGSVPIVAYRDFSDDGRTPDNGIYVATPNAEDEFVPVKAAQIFSPVENHFSQKFDDRFQTQFRALSAPSMAVNAVDGTVYVVYDDARDGKSLTYLVKSTDGGKTWCDPKPVGDPAHGGPNADHWMSAVNVDPLTGAVAVGFLGLDDNGNYAPYTSLSVDGGNHWTVPEQVSGYSNFMLDRFGGQFSGDYTAIKIRSQANNDGTTTFHIHYAHPTAYGTDDPTVRISRPVSTRLTYPTSLIRSVYALSRDSQRAQAQAGSDWLKDQLQDLVNTIEWINGQKTPESR